MICCCHLWVRIQLGGKDCNKKVINMIKRRDLLISYIISFIGFFQLIFPVILYPDIENKDNSVKILVLIFFALMVVSGIYRSVKCRCPYCGAGKLFNVSTYARECSIFKEEFTCPDCGRKVRIVKNSKQ